MTKVGVGESVKISLPLTEAFRISIDNIRLRFSRALVTVTSVILGIAFLSFLLVSSAIFRSTPGSGIPFQLIQYWLAYLSLLVSVVSITNSMLMAVYERYKEIGTMKVLGALDRHILLLFLIESSLLGAVGGLLGFLAGASMAVLISGSQLGFEAVLHVSAYDILFSFALSMVLATGLSVVATVYPAYRAAKSNPAEALRFEI